MYGLRVISEKYYTEILKCLLLETFQDVLVIFSLTMFFALQLLAYIVEGRRTGVRRRTPGTTAQYRKLKAGEDDE